MKHFRYTCSMLWPISFTPIPFLNFLNRTIIKGNTGKIKLMQGFAQSLSHDASFKGKKWNKFLVRTPRLPSWRFWALFWGLQWSKSLNFHLQRGPRRPPDPPPPLFHQAMHAMFCVAQKILTKIHCQNLVCLV